MDFDYLSYAKWLVQEYGFKGEAHDEKERFVGSSFILCFERLQIIYFESEKSGDFEIFYNGRAVYNENVLGNITKVTINDSEGWPNLLRQRWFDFSRKF
ncbi:hypothetical protein COX97_01820 [Candidatus Pacearchaeota archaeon CG_4_10_14_0_2_um_filter_05_32_18]|nr:MAG: hypothetical protein AUJ62_01305 [Candidatus Pacearchaeota archaeon CG1_02_32_21]PIZ83055.1 MAG: hypothetical protein COX97_01820 [Candidatus Pacearchaeota archaeon CG_4_10_14_0_2_um_filter_05_32_18]